MGSTLQICSSAISYSHRPDDKGTAGTTQIRRLNTVQRLAMKAILGCYRTTPTAAMEIAAIMDTPSNQRMRQPVEITSASLDHYRNVINYDNHATKMRSIGAI